MLWGCRISMHQVPNSNGIRSGIGIMVQIWGTQRVVHFMAHRWCVEIRRGISQLEIKCPHPFSIDIDISAKESPFMGPKQRIPCAHTTFYNETDIVDITIIVIIYVQVRRHWVVAVDIVHGTFQQSKLPLCPFIILVSIGIGGRIIRFEIAMRIDVLIGNNGLAVVSWIEGGGYLDGTIRSRPEIWPQGNGTFRHIVEHIVDVVIGIGELFIVRETDEYRNVVECAVVGDVVAVLRTHFGYFPNPPLGHPFFGRNKGVRLEALACRVLPACYKLGCHQLAVAFFGINIITRLGMLHNGIAIFIVQIVEKLITRSKAVQNGTIGLVDRHRDVS